MKVKCSCSHEYQDKKYGAGIRIANRVEKHSDPIWRCTVCGKEQLVGSATLKRKGKK